MPYSYSLDVREKHGTRYRRIVTIPATDAAALPPPTAWDAWAVMTIRTLAIPWKAAGWEAVTTLHGWK